MCSSQTLGGIERAA